MTISHHPLPETLAAFAAGNLDEGCSAVMASHLAACPECRHVATMCERVSGALLERLPASAMADDALSVALRRLDAPPSPGDAAASAEAAAPLREDGIVYPTALAPYALGPWRRIGPGIERRSVRMPPHAGSRLFLLRAAPGARLPRHTHTGIELTCLLKGAYRHDFGRYRAGDLDEADESVAHRPVIEPGEACICLVALEGRVRLSGFVGRLLQPFVRM